MTHNIHTLSNTHVHYVSSNNQCCVHVHRFEWHWGQSDIFLSGHIFFLHTAGQQHCVWVMVSCMTCNGFLEVWLEHCAQSTSDIKTYSHAASSAHRLYIITRALPTITIGSSSFILRVLETVWHFIECCFRSDRAFVCQYRYCTECTHGECHLIGLFLFVNMFPSQIMWLCVFRICVYLLVWKEGLVDIL